VCELDGSVDEAFRRSNKALIQAKRQGRNQVVTVVGKAI